jgi:hypothetical protein
MRKLLLFILLAGFVAACSDENQGELVESPAPAEPAGAVESATTADAGDQLPVGHPPINEQMPQMSMGQPVQPGFDNTIAIEGNTVTIGPISFEIAEGWKSAPPSSSMRAAQFVVPPAEGQLEPAELAIFQGISGSQDQNIQRWVNQFQIPEGQNLEDVMTIEKRQVGDFNIQTLDIQGAYSGASMGGPMMGGGAAPVQENMRLLAAAIEGPGGPWHFKLVGPAETVAAQKDEFEALLASLKVVK